MGQNLSGDQQQDDPGQVDQRREKGAQGLASARSQEPRTVLPARARVLLARKLPRMSHVRSSIVAAMIQPAASVTVSLLPGAPVEVAASQAGSTAAFVNLFVDALAALGRGEANPATALLATMAGAVPAVAGQKGSAVEAAEAGGDDASQPPDLLVLFGFVPGNPAPPLPVERPVAAQGGIQSPGPAIQGKNLPVAEAQIAAVSEDVEPVDLLLAAADGVRGLRKGGAEGGALPAAGHHLAALGSDPSPSSPTSTSPGPHPAIAEAGRQALGMMPGAVAAPGEKLHLAVATPFGTPQWSREFGEQLVWLVGRRGQTAEITLNPPNLGTLEVRLSVHAGEAGAQFFSAVPAVREAIQAALPQLREMLAGAGLSLGEAMVSDQSLHQRDARQTGSVSGANGNAEGVPADGAAGAGDGAIFLARGRGLVDVYA